MDIYRYWEVCANQDADELRTFFHKDATVLWHNTNECFTSEEFICANCDYPGSWQGEVKRVDEIEGGLVTAVHIFSKTDTLVSFHVTSFFHMEHDKIVFLEEYRGEDGEPPDLETKKKDRKTDCSLTKVINRKPCSCFALHGFLISTFSVRAL